MKFLQSLILVFAVSVCFSQAGSPNSRVVDFLGSEKYQETLSSNPGLIKYLEAKLQFGFELTDKINEKSTGLKTLADIPYSEFSKDGILSSVDFVNSFLAGSLNVLHIQLPADPNADNYYVIGSTGYILVVKSNSYINSQIK
ncbi:MAG: hypothetical protein IPM74_15045 [Crocinitomicaceae bacterium]|nr:hypothetical protein [Crocinitomicaceae bacterium]MBK8927188.1 hypothetical protein [Crocinitomicaceae bacterium]